MLTPDSPPRADVLPDDAAGVLKLAAQSMFDTLASTAMGMTVVDREHRNVWISEGDKQFLPALGRAEADFVGRRVSGRRHRTSSHLPHKTLSADALDLLARQPWPGNIRELRNAVEEATLTTDELLLTAAHFIGLRFEPGVPVVPAMPAMPAMPAVNRAGNVLARPAVAADPGIAPLPQAVAALEARAIRDARVATGGNKLAASRRLGMSRATLYEKLPLIGHLS